MNLHGVSIARDGGDAASDTQTSESLFSWADILLQLDRMKTGSEISTFYGSRQSLVLNATSGIIIFITITR